MGNAKITNIAAAKLTSKSIFEDAKELQALFSYGSERMVALNKVRALTDIEMMMDSLKELKAYIDVLD